MGRTTRKLMTAAIASAVAATSQTALSEGLEELIVTAQKREQNAMDVPLSVAPVDEELLESIFDGGADVRALSGRVPGLYVESSNGRVAPRFYIRGLGNTDFDLAASQPVSVIMDGVVAENVILKSFPIFDQANVEVLRGPQGTLFGRNTTAGIVQFTSARPTEETEGYIDLTYGTFGSYNIEGAISGSMNDNLTARLSVLNQHRDDWISNGYTMESDVMGGFDETAFRLQFLWTPSETTDFLLNIHQRDLDGTAAMFRANIWDKGSNDLNENFDRDVVYYDSPYNNPQSYKSEGVSLTINSDFDEVTLTSITAVDFADGSSLGDIDGGYGCAFCGTEFGPGFIPFDSTTKDELQGLRQFTQELRFAGNAGDNVQWQSGVYYFDAGFDVTTSPFFVPPTTVRHENTLTAIFGQAEIDMAEATTLVVGARYTSDEKRFYGPDIEDSIKDNKFSGDIALNYDIAEGQMVYGRIANGFRGPSIQGRDMAFSGTYSIAESETVTSFELGYKAELNDSVRINAAVYTYTVEDMQFTAVGGESNSIRLLNAEEGAATGMEVDLTWMATDNLVFTAGYAYVNTEIRDDDLYVNPCGNFGDFICTINDPLVEVDGAMYASIDGNPFPNSPETTANITASYVVPTQGGEMFFYTDWMYQGDTNIFLYDAVEFKTDGQFEGGIRVGFRADENWEVSFFGRNITDEENVQGAIDFNNLTGFVNEPRVFGIQGKYSM